MSTERKERSYYISKTAIGGLFKALAMDTDPAHTLYFTSALINSSRAALVQKLEDQVDSHTLLPNVMNAILKTLAMNWKNQGVLKEDLIEINKKIDAVFKSEAMFKYGLEIYRDIVFCDNLIIRWDAANNIYRHDHDAWAISNSQLVQIHKQLFEIIFRHELMQLPKGESFNVDDHSSSMNEIMGAISEYQKGKKVPHEIPLF